MTEHALPPRLEVLTPDLGNEVAIVSISIHDRDCAHRDLTRGKQMINFLLR